MAIVQIPFAYDYFFYKLLQNAIRIDITRECPYIQIECPNLCQVDCPSLKDSKKIHEGIDISSFPLVSDKPKLAPSKNLTNISNPKYSNKTIKRLENAPDEKPHDESVRLTSYSMPFVVEGEHMISASYNLDAQCNLGFLKTFEPQGEKNDKQTQ